MQIVVAAAVVVVVQWDVGCWNYCRPVKKYRTCLRLPHWDWLTWDGGMPLYVDFCIVT